MEKKYKDITGRTDEEKTYDLKNEEDVNKIIKQLEQEETAQPPPWLPTPKEPKPVWAKTKNQIDQEEEKEIEDLIEFAYELDYEKFVEDMEVR
mgnify:FL=1